MNSGAIVVVLVAVFISIFLIGIPLFSDQNQKANSIGNGGTLTKDINTVNFENPEARFYTKIEVKNSCFIEIHGDLNKIKIIETNDYWEIYTQWGTFNRFHKDFFKRKSERCWYKINDFNEVE